MARKRRSTYQTYFFTNQDPVIDVVRTIVQITASLRGVSFGKVVRQIERDSGVSANCMHGWFSGATRRPQHATIAAVVHACGKEITVGGKEIGHRPRFKVHQGGKKVA